MAAVTTEKSLSNPPDPLKEVAQSPSNIKTTESASESAFPNDECSSQQDWLDRPLQAKDRPSSVGWSWRHNPICGQCMTSSTKNEMKALLQLSWPIILTLFMQFLLTWVNIFFSGLIGKVELNAAGLATSFSNVTGKSIGIGFSTACDTLISQACGGKNMTRVGIILQKGILILSFLLLPLWAVWLQTESLLLLLQQDPEVARLSGTFVKILMIGLPGNFLYVLLIKYLQNQGVVKPQIFVGGVVLLSSILAHYIAVIVLDLRLVGSAAALAFSQVLQPCVCLAVIRYKKLGTETWHGWSWESLSDWRHFLRLALPGTVMVCVEWWSFEAVFFICGTISDVDLATNVIFFQVLSVLFMVPLGNSFAACIRVGTFLGANKPLSAKRSAWVAVVIIAIWSVLMGTVITALRSFVGYIYTSDRAVIQLVSKTIPLLAIFLLFDNAQTAVQGIFRGSGRQKTGAIVNALGFYCVAFPVGIPLALSAEMGVFGLWVGMCIGVSALAILGIVLILKFDWQDEAKKARVRAGVYQPPVDTNDSFNNPENIEQPICLEELEKIDETAESEVAQLLENEAQSSEIQLDSMSDSVAFDAESEIVVLTTHHHTLITHKNKHRILLHRLLLFMAGVLLLVASGVASHYEQRSHNEETICNDSRTGLFNLRTTELPSRGSIIRTLTRLPQSDTAVWSRKATVSEVSARPCSIFYTITIVNVATEDQIKVQVHMNATRPLPSPVIPVQDGEELPTRLHTSTTLRQRTTKTYV